MRHGSLFSGIGGFDLAAEWMGWENIFHCEINSFGQQVLKYYWPNAISYTDIKTTDFSIHRGTIDVLSDGFPCQPYSTAGKRLGKEDDRHLWPEMLRAIREIQPGWVVGENVRGLTNWNGGMVFDEVQADLEAEGYEVLPFLLPACAVNAPHRRDRIWFIAYNANARVESMQQREDRIYETEFTSDASSNGQQQRGFGQDRPKKKSGHGIEKERERIRGNNRGTGEQGAVANANAKGLQNRQQLRIASRTGENRNKQSDGFLRTTWERFPAQPPLRCRNDGISSELAGITFSKHRNESIKAFGNAIVPQEALEIFKAIAQY